jgi:ribosomal RNA-processing protein 7
VRLLRRNLPTYVAMAPEKPSKALQTRPTPKTVAEFTILPLTLPALPGLPAQYKDARHYLFVKPQAMSIPTKNDERSLYMVNVPIDASENSIRALFAEQLGGAMVERVESDAPIPAQPMHKRWKADKPQAEKPQAGRDRRGKKRKRGEEEALVAEGVVEDEDSALPRLWPGTLSKSGSGAVVIFVDKNSARGALKAIQKAVKEGTSILWKSGDAALGVERKSRLYLSICECAANTTQGYRQHNTLTYATPSSLRTSINAYLTQFNTIESLRNKHRTLARSMPDEEGFVTVTRGGRTGPARLEDTEKKQEELAQRKKKNAVKDGFYRFQNRERRKEVEMGLRKRFEEDRQRVMDMRERRGKVRPET